MFTPSPTGSGSSISATDVAMSTGGITAFLSVFRSVMGSTKQSPPDEQSSTSPSSSPESSSENAVLRGSREDAVSDNSASEWLRGRAWGGVGEGSRCQLNRRKEKGDCDLACDTLRDGGSLSCSPKAAEDDFPRFILNRERPRSFSSALFSRELVWLRVREVRPNMEGSDFPNDILAESGDLTFGLCDSDNCCMCFVGALEEVSKCLLVHCLKATGGRERGAVGSKVSERNNPTPEAPEAGREFDCTSGGATELLLLKTPLALNALLLPGRWKNDFAFRLLVGKPELVLGRLKKDLGLMLLVGKPELLLGLCMKADQR